MTITDPEMLTVSPLEMDTGIGNEFSLITQSLTNEMESLEKEYFRYYWVTLKAFCGSRNIISLPIVYVKSKLSL